MSCAHGQQLEALAAGELDAPRAAALEAHAQHCARCRHELRWLLTEQGLLRQRASRELVSHLWRDAAVPRPAASVRRTPAAVAALVVGLLLLGGWRARSRTASESAEPAAVVTASAAAEVSDAPSDEGLQVSQLLWSTSEARALCSTLPAGLGFRCGPVESSRIFASR